MARMRSWKRVLISVIASASPATVAVAACGVRTDPDLAVLGRQHGSVQDARALTQYDGAARVAEGATWAVSGTTGLRPRCSISMDVSFSRVRRQSR